MLARSPAPPLADMAVEIAIARTDMASIAFALAWQAMHAAEEETALANLAARVGLPVELTRRVVEEHGQRHADLIAAAHRLIVALIPHEDAVRRLIGEVP